MTGNSFGQLFKFSTWGESHGLALGCVIEGVPSNIPLSEKDIQPWLNKRRPGKSKYTSQRKEPDKVKILSGVFKGKTTGAPISLQILNVDAKSKDYGEISQMFRPGHADYTYQRKYGIRDYRGSGRASARETAMRVAAGAIARKILGKRVKIRGAVIQLGPHKINRSRWSWKTAEHNELWCPDKQIVNEWKLFLKKIRKQGTSTGAIIEIVASGIPPGLGEPVYDKLDAELAKAFVSIPAVKGVEIGSGFAAASLTGESNSDQIRIKKGKPSFLSNNAGGILGGISTGQEVVARFCVKPTSSILVPQKSINTKGKEVTIRTKGRHDPCVGIRAVPIGEAMMAVVLADHLLRNKIYFETK
jgi:chorismate synthase